MTCLTNQPNNQTTTNQPANKPNNQSINSLELTVRLQVKKVYAFPTNLFNIHFNIILPAKPRPSTWFLSSRFIHQNSVRNSTLFHTRHMSLFSHSSWFDNPDNIWRETLVSLRIISVSFLLHYLSNALNSFWYYYNRRSFVHPL